MLTTVLVNFNHGRYLPLSLQSIFRQTRPPDELIVIDDASTDDSIEVVARLLPGHSNARLVRNQVNQGTVANMNDGLRLAQGSYIHFAAADDLFYPRLYETAVDLMTANPGAAVFSSRSDVIDENGRSLDAPIPRAGYPSRRPTFLTPDDVARHLMREDAWFMGNAAVFRRECLVAAGGFSNACNRSPMGICAAFSASNMAPAFRPTFSPPGAASRKASLRRRRRRRKERR